MQKEPAHGTTTDPSRGVPPLLSTAPKFPHKLPPKLAPTFPTKPPPQQLLHQLPQSLSATALPIQYKKKVLVVHVEYKQKNNVETDVANTSAVTDAYGQFQISDVGFAHIALMTMTWNSKNAQAPERRSGTHKRRSSGH